MALTTKFLCNVTEYLVSLPVSVQVDLERLRSSESESSSLIRSRALLIVPQLARDSPGHAVCCQGPSVDGCSGGSCEGLLNCKHNTCSITLNSVYYSLQKIGRTQPCLRVTATVDLPSIVFSFCDHLGYIASINTADDKEEPRLDTLHKERTDDGQPEGLAFLPGDEADMRKPETLPERLWRSVDKTLSHGALSR